MNRFFPAVQTRVGTSLRRQDFPFKLHRSDLAPDRRKEEDNVCSGFAVAHIISLLSQGSRARFDLSEKMDFDV